MSLPHNKPIRVLLVDDHELVRMGQKALLERFPHLLVVGEAGNVADAMDEITHSKPDLILLDVRLPDQSGLDVCRFIQKNRLDIKVLVLTAFADDEIILESIQAGADGYLLKELNAEGLVRAISDVMEGKSILDPAVTEHIFGKIRTLDSSTKGKLDLLSPQERRVLALVAEGKTNKEIAQDLGLSDKTVKNYLSHLLEKLQISRRSQAAAIFAQQSDK